MCSHGVASCSKGLHPGQTALPVGAAAIPVGAPLATPKPKAASSAGGSSGLTAVPCQAANCKEVISYDKAAYAAKTHPDGSPNPWSEPKWCHACKQLKAAGGILCVDGESGEEVD